MSKLGTPTRDLRCVYPQTTLLKREFERPQRVVAAGLDGAEWDAHHAILLLPEAHTPRGFLTLAKLGQRVLCI
jgi:hypothetical protein